MSPPALRGFGPLGLAAIVLILASNFLFLPLSDLLLAFRLHDSQFDAGSVMALTLQ